MDRIKSTAWFEVNPSFGSRDIRLGGQFCPPPLTSLGLRDFNEFYGKLRNFNGFKGILGYLKCLSGFQWI